VHGCGDRHQATVVGQGVQTTWTPTSRSPSPASSQPVHTDAVRGFVFDVATGKLNEVKA
jgi:hypothetical protein